MRERPPRSILDDTVLASQVIVSQWTWAATLLQSSNVASQYGLSGPFWYAAGATVQILLFGILAIEIKKKAPNMHTFLEMIDVRWGKKAHMTFLFFGICTNLIVTGMLLQGGAAVVNAASGMHIIAANFLIPGAAPRPRVRDPRRGRAQLRHLPRVDGKVEIACSDNRRLEEAQEEGAQEAAASIVDGLLARHPDLVAELRRANLDEKVIKAMLELRQDFQLPALA